jgi:pimeloyl-ACP methyl ester carboxylesterase
MHLFMIAMMLVTAATTAPYAQDIKVTGEDIRVPYENGVQIFVRNKRPEGVQTFKSDRIAIMMHGATYPGTAFDVPLAGKSWMDYMAERGFDVYALDLPGYGRSTRPAAMDLPPDQNSPFMRGADAVKALGAVVDYVRMRRGVEKLNLIGWSWGTTICATYTTENQGKVERLVLYAPAWLRTTPSLVQVQGKLGAYRVVTREQRSLAYGRA